MQRGEKRQRETDNAIKKTEVVRRDGDREGKDEWKVKKKKI